jgi:hypothetical protein
MRTKPLGPLSLALTAGLMALATPAIAQDTSSVPEANNPEARREMLNASQAQKAERQVEANENSQAEHDIAVGMNAMENEHNAIAYDDALNRHDAQEQAYRAARKDWERKNPACWDGDAAKCPADPGS